MTSPCIITVAITGSLPRKENNPSVPITVAEQVEATHEAYEAGASLVHIHVRNDDQTPTSKPDRFAEVQAGIARHCPGMIIQFSTGGRSGVGTERGGMLPLRPDMASLSTGSCNFPSIVYLNPPDLILFLAEEMAKYQISPEIEAFDLSMLYQAVRLGRGRQDPEAAPCAIRVRHQECDARHPPGARIPGFGIEAADAGSDLGRCRHRQASARSQFVDTRTRRPLPHRARGQCPLRRNPACQKQCRTRQTRRRSVRQV